MDPGVAHCSGGLGPHTFDGVTPAMTWVESGAAPSETTGLHELVRLAKIRVCGHPVDSRARAPT
jgi:hypothetical protein